MRLRWSVRARTTATAVAVLLPVLTVAGAAGVWFQRDDLSAGVASLAEAQARSIARDVPDGSRPDLGGEEDVVQIVSLRTGEVIVTTAGLGSAPLLPAPTTSAPVHAELSQVLPGETDRYAAVALRAGDGSSYVVTARSLESVDAATASTTGLFAVGGLLVLVTTGALTWIATGRALSPVEAIRRRADSIPADDLTSRLPVPAADDEIARLALTLNQLLARQAEAATAQRTFVADASHELRSPVATIRALLESDRITPHPGGPAGLAAEVLEETSRLAALVDDLLLLARGDARRPAEHRRLDLSALVAAEAQRTRSVPVTAEIDEHVWVTGEQTPLRAAVRNLLDNAERFAVERIVVSARREPDVVVIEVVDDGPGIPEADRERVFERFVRLDDARTRADGGTGLGLAIVRQVAEDHAGSVDVHPGPPGGRRRGARFVISLPVDPVDPVDPARTAPRR